MPKTHQKEGSRNAPFFVFNISITITFRNYAYICFMEFTKSIRIEHGDVSLTIIVDDDLKKLNSECGYIEIMNTKVCWDNLPYFKSISRKELKKDCNNEEKLILKGRYKKVLKTIKKLLKEAEKHGIL